MIQLNSNPVRRAAAIASIVISLLATTRGFGQQAEVGPTDCRPIPRLIPPVGIEVPKRRRTDWLSKMDSLELAAGKLDSQLEADVAVLLKACRYAIEFREFYREKDFDKVDRLLQLAGRRTEEIQGAGATWPQAAGRQVRGFRSRVDGSVQPVGLVLPENWQTQDTSHPLYVWLHGRGDKVTDLHFICDRLDKDGQIVPEGAIVVHPFGRQCIGFKSAGETDVMEAIDFVCRNYPVDERRIVLMGFSMGGAGVWHLAAHYGERFVAASPGAGFAETARYQRLAPEKFPPKYEQILWSIYDVPGYTRNLFNSPVVAYSGEKDKQIQAARVMEEAFEAEGRELMHQIGPGMGHKYHPDTLKTILAQLAQVVEQGKPQSPERLFIQSRHPRYSARRWLTIDGAVKQYHDTRVDAERTGHSRWTLKTKNVSRLRLVLPSAENSSGPSGEILVDGHPVELSSDAETLLQRGEDGSWHVVDHFAKIRKRPGLSGPIDDAFVDPFLVVTPSGSSSSPEVERWTACELENFRQRWRTLFRGELRMKEDVEVTAQDIRDYHLVLWGEPSSNRVMRHVFSGRGQWTPPVRVTKEHWKVGDSEHAADKHVLAAIFPNPLAPEKYVVINSGPTFRQAHDRTNSLQNPHLPDWAIISLDEPPSAERPGRVVSTGFFSDSWQYDSNLTW